jgi:hypothetical protein
MMFRSLAPAVLLLSFYAFAQEMNPKPALNDEFVQKQFGTTCKLIPGPQPQAADLNGDGIEDIVIIAHCSNPLIDQAEDHFQVVDPYNSFFGYGDTKITTQFASEAPERRGIVLLIIHGEGPEAWRSATPKAKFVVINLPFKRVLVRKLTVKKKSVMAVYAEETGGDNMTSAIFWDGRKYRYQPFGAGLE